MPGIKYEAFVTLSVSGWKEEEKECFSGSLEVRQGDNYKDVSFRCSKTFYSNILWFRELKDAEQLKEWEIQGHKHY